MAHRQGCDSNASFEPRKVLPIAAHDCHRQADSTSRHSTALATEFLEWLDFWAILDYRALV